jgi:hypothetical protein
MQVWMKSLRTLNPRRREESVATITNTISKNSQIRLPIPTNTEEEAVATGREVEGAEC